MDEITSSRISGIIDRIKRVETDTEHIYLSLGNTFPLLSAEAKKSSGDARAAIDAVMAVDKNKNLSATTHGVSEILTLASKYFERTSQRDGLFLENIESGSNQLAGLSSVIQRVRSDSEEMELISLNAMTVAIKSGAEGRAFSIITEELKRLSARTINLTVDIEHKGGDLLVSFKNLESILERMSIERDTFFDKVQSVLNEGFERLAQEIKKASEEFKHLADEALQVNKPISEIMQAIQLQDIIRQSLDHVIISLNESTKDSGASRIDELAFAVTAIELSNALLDDIIAQTQESHATLKTNIEGVVSAVTDLEARRQDFVQSSREGQGGESVGKDIAVDPMAYISGKAQALESARKTALRVNMLDDDFKVLGTILSRFKNIVIASRIETARRKVLANRSNTVFAMDQLTERIENDVGEASNLTRSFIKSASKEISEYARSREEDTERLERELIMINGELDRLSQMRQRAHEAVSAFRLYTVGFISAIDESKVALSGLAQLIGEMTGMRSELDALARETMALAGEEGGVDLHAYKIKSERLKEMIERFTIFTHKKSAADLGSFNVETGAGTGEIMLF